MCSFKMAQLFKKFGAISADNINRVCLRPGGQKGSDYINASFIDVSNFLVLNYIIYNSILVASKLMISLLWIIFSFRSKIQLRTFL